MALEEESRAIRDKEFARSGSAAMSKDAATRQRGSSRATREKTQAAENRGTQSEEGQAASIRRAPVRTPVMPQANTPTKPSGRISEVIIPP